MPAVGARKRETAAVPRRDGGNLALWLKATLRGMGGRVVLFQKAASSTSISALSVFSTMPRSADKRGSTWVAKNRVAASLPS